MDRINGLLAGDITFEMVPATDPWVLAANVWPHLDWQQESPLKWRDFVKLKAECRDFATAGKAPQNNGAFSRYVVAVLAGRCYVDLDGSADSCEVFNSTTGAWKVIPRKALPSKILDVLKSLALPGLPLLHPLEEPRFAKSLVNGVLSRLSEGPRMSKLDREHARDKMLFRNGMVWDFKGNRSHRALPQHRLMAKTACDFAPWVAPDHLPDVFAMICRWIVDRKTAKLGLENSDLGCEIIKTLEDLCEAGCELLVHVKGILRDWSQDVLLALLFKMLGGQPDEYALPFQATTASATPRASERWSMLVATSAWLCFRRFPSTAVSVAAC